MKKQVKSYAIRRRARNPRPYSSYTFRRVGFVILAKDERDALTQFAKHCGQEFEIKGKGDDTVLAMTTVSGAKEYVAWADFALEREVEAMLTHPDGLNCKVVTFN